MSGVFKIGDIEHTKGGSCQSCFNGFPHNCPNPACDGYMHGHHIDIHGLIKVEVLCDLCGKECEKYL